MPDGAVSMLYVVLFFWAKAQKAKRRSSEESLLALRTLLRLAKLLIGVESGRGAWSPFEEVLQCPLMSDPDGYVRTMGLVPEHEALNVFFEFDLPWPHDIPDALENPAHCMKAEHLLAMLIRTNRTPFGPLCALAALMEDGVRRCNCLHYHKQYAVPLGQKRVRVSRTDKAVAFRKFLQSTEHGIRSAMEIKMIDPDVKIDAPADSSASLIGPDEPIEENASARNECEEAVCLKNEKKKYYRRVVEEGSLLL